MTETDETQITTEENETSEEEVLELTEIWVEYPNKIKVKMKIGGTSWDVK